MPKCFTCGDRYQLTPFNNTNKCESCIDDETYDTMHEHDVDIELLKNPSGRTRAVFYDDTDDQS